jgi:hypothetical protein
MLMRSTFHDILSLDVNTECYTKWTWRRETNQLRGCLFGTLNMPPVLPATGELREPEVLAQLGPPGRFLDINDGRGLAVASHELVV